jgi:hypothetical protein
MYKYPVDLEFAGFASLQGYVSLSGQMSPRCNLLTVETKHRGLQYQGINKPGQSRWHHTARSTDQEAGGSRVPVAGASFHGYEQGGFPGSNFPWRFLGFGRCPR